MRTQFGKAAQNGNLKIPQRLLCDSDSISMEDWQGSGFKL